MKRRGPRRAEIKLLLKYIEDNKPNGYSVLAKELGYNSQSTIRNWVSANALPKCYKTKIMEVLNESIK